VINPEAPGRFHWTKVLVDTFVSMGVLLFCSSSSGVSAAIQGVSLRANSFRKYTWKYSFYGADSAIEHAIRHSQLLPDPE
jgi:hypothetical protein